MDPKVKIYSAQGPSDRQRAFERGWRDHDAGVSADDCPYLSNDEMVKAWCRGWMRAAEWKKRNGGD